MKIFCFFFLKKPRYNRYKARELAIPTLICSNLYLEPRYNQGTKGTKVKLILIINAYLSKCIDMSQQIILRKYPRNVQKPSNTNDLRVART